MSEPFGLTLTPSHFTNRSVQVTSQNLTLTLLVTSVGANDIHAAFSAYDFAVLTHSFDAGANLHRGPSNLQNLETGKAHQYMAR